MICPPMPEVRFYVTQIERCLNGTVNVREFVCFRWDEVERHFAGVPDGCTWITMSVQVRSDVVWRAPYWPSSPPAAATYVSVQVRSTSDDAPPDEA